MQTDWLYPKNAAVQCEPREFTEEEKVVIQESDEMAEFISNVAQRSVILCGMIAVGVVVNVFASNLNQQICCLPDPVGT